MRTLALDDRDDARFLAWALDKLGFGVTVYEEPVVALGEPPRVGYRVEVKDAADDAPPPRPHTVRDPEPHEDDFGESRWWDDDGQAWRRRDD